jgi:hypothetical protein
VILEAMLGNYIFQLICTENVSLETEQALFPKCGRTPTAGTMHHKENLAICNVLTCPGMKDLSRLLPERKSPMILSFIMLRNIVTILGRL